MTATTGRTVLAIIAILSLLLSAFALARPVVAQSGDHCPGGGEGAPAGAINESEGSIEDSGVLIEWSGDPGTVTITNNTDGDAIVVFCAKGGDDFANGSKNSGEITVTLEPGESVSYDFGTQISYFVLYSVEVAPDIEVDKTGSELSKIGDEVTYTVTITNLSDFTAYRESITDDPHGDLTDECPATLAPAGQAGDTCVIEYTMDVPAGAADPFGNVVTAVYDSRATLDGLDGSDSDSHDVNLFQPSVSVEKVASPSAVEVGAEVDYTITITNTGSADSPALVFDAIDDSLAGDLLAECAASLAVTDSCVIEYSLTAEAAGEICNEVSVETHPDGFPNDVDGSDTACVTVTAPEEPTGSITINKELDECVACEAFTPGYWFNRGGGGGVSWANDWLAANPQVIAGVSDADGFGSVAEVQAYLDWDRSGGDGANGLSATGQLLRHYLALVLNVAFADANDCNLLDLVYGDADIATWLQRAFDALTGDATDAEKEAIKDALDAINNSDAGDGTLECPSEGTGGSVAGFTFKLWVFDEEAGELVVINEMTTGDTGSVTFSGLELGVEYTITEVAPEGLECTIVSAWLGETELEVVDGMITVTLTEGEDTANVTITVVNDCEQPGEEDEFGDVVIIKDADDDTDEPFGFSASWTGDGDDFDLTDGQAWPSGDVLAGTVITVTEELTNEQVLAGWSLENIDCGDADVTVDGTSVTITVMPNTTITCTFTNELEEQPDNGLVEIDKLFCFTDGDASTEFLVLPPTLLPATLDALGQVEDELPDSGCWTEAVSFTITGGDLEEPLEWTTDDNGNLEEVLPASENPYVITEDLTGESAQFFIEDGALTAIVVLNLVEEEDEGLVKVIKLFCETADADDAGVTFVVEGGNAPVPVISGCTLGDATFELGDLEITTEGGIALELVVEGEYTFAETDPNVAEHDELIVVTEGEITTIIVFNTFVEGEQGGNPGGGSGPGQAETPREGTAGGNPLPNTATTPAPGGSLPAILLALMALGALGVGGHRMAAEARSRR